MASLAVTAAPRDPLLVVIAGATGSGKTALSLQLAEMLHGEIISCDSVAVYREMDIGTAKPSPEQRAQVPHHMLDILFPDQQYSAGDYGRAARSVVREIAAHKHIPIIAGGTGLYLRALLDGLSPVPPRDESLRNRLLQAAKRRGPVLLHRLLRRLDPEAAARIHANDASKLIRAIEVSALTGQSMSTSWTEQQPEPLIGFRTVQIGLQPDRAELYRRIDRRCAAMFVEGLIAETSTLVERYGADCRPLLSLGYAEAQAVLRGELTEAEAVAKAQQGHRNYSKRQGTWFRRDPRIHWIPAFGEDALDEAAKHIVKQPS